MKIPAALSIFLLVCSLSAAAAERHRDSPGATTYYIDPAAGDDSRSGLARDQAWRTFHHLGQLRLAPGDRVEIVAPGELTQTLSLSGSGTAERPIEVRFAPGRYDVRPDGLHREAWQISNTNSDPDTPKAVALHVNSASHIRVSGPGARFVARGKMIHVCIEESDRIAIDGLAFDYHRPTVSEFKVSEADADSAVLEIHRDSAYSVTDGKLLWQGEGWTETGGLGQQLDPTSGRVHRMADPLKGLVFEELRPFSVRASGSHRLQAGHIYQLRNPFRDCAGVFIRRSRDVTWKDVRFHFLHGMGVVSQFSENLTFDTVSVAPDPDSGRTTAAWADCFHFSGCRGRIVVEDCVFSGAHDDAINIHGTYLRMVEKLSGKQIKVRFMHPQTFGFMAFNAGDEVGFVHPETMATLANNRVAAATMPDPKELLLTLEQPVPDGLPEDAVLENLAWNAEAEIRGCKVSHIPTRGFLLTSSRRMLVEDNEFIATHSSAIQVDADARKWYESGAVHDLTIRRNRFLHCGEPVIAIQPRNSAPNPAFHRNIRILENEFILGGDNAVGASGTTGLRVSGNTIRAAAPLDDTRAIRTRDCGDLSIEGNDYQLLAE